MLPTSKLKIVNKLGQKLDPLISKYFKIWKFQVIKFEIKHSKYIHPSANSKHEKIKIMCMYANLKDK